MIGRYIEAKLAGNSTAPMVRRMQQLPPVRIVAAQQRFGAVGEHHAGTAVIEHFRELDDGDRVEQRFARISAR